MNIVYGVSGEGLGHVFEAIEIIGRLKKDGHAVKVLTYGDRAVRSLQSFAPTRIEGIQLYFNERGLSLPDTVRRNLRCIPFHIRNWPRLRRELEGFQPDVFITAYEPFTTFASHMLRRPLISMDNQNELLHVRGHAGPRTFAFGLAKLATRICTHGAAHYIVKSFDKTPRGAGNVHFVYPIIQNEIRAVQPVSGRHVLVYLTKPNPGLIEVMKTIDEEFIVYCNNRVGAEANITYRAQGAGYVGDLGGCKAIIGTTGFSLIADSIFLRKPYYGVPLKGQFEQTYNALFVRRSGFGDFSENPSRGDIKAFLDNLDAYRDRLAGYKSDPAEQEETLIELLALTRPASVPAAFTGSCP